MLSWVDDDTTNTIAIEQARGVIDGLGSGLAEKLLVQSHCEIIL